MKTILTGIALSLSALIATSTMAAPHHEARHDKNRPAPHAAHWDKKDGRHWQQQRVDQKHYNGNRINPSRDWKVGHALPRQFTHSNYRLSSSESRHLPKTKRDQQWYKVNGDYVLVNERNNRIVRILG